MKGLREVKEEQVEQMGPMDKEIGIMSSFYFYMRER